MSASTDYWPTPAAARALRDLAVPGRPTPRSTNRSLTALRQHGLLTLDADQHPRLTDLGGALALSLGLACAQDQPHSRHAGCEGSAGVLIGGRYDPCSDSTSCRLLFAHPGACWKPPLY